MITKLKNMRQQLYGLVAFSLLAIFALQGTVFTSLAAAGQVQTRAIYMNSSTPSATSTTYLVTFKPSVTTSLKGIIVDFCKNSPIIGDSTCTAPDSPFTIGTPTVTFSSTTAGTNAPVTSTALPGTWGTISSLNSGRTLKMLSAAGSGALVTSTLYNFAITTVTNPAATTSTFYARIITYNLDSGDIASYAPGTEGSTNLVDTGGFALSTAAVINVTAKVQESLSFCVYASSCGDDPSFSIGATVGAQKILDTALVYTATTNFSISTNAQTGVGVRVKGDTLKSGGNTIPAAGAAATAFVAGTANFGVRVSTPGTNITAVAPYNGAANNYGLDVGTANENLTTTYGDQIASLSAATNASISTLTWGATAGNTTPAGIYTAAEQLIATGTY